MPWMKHNLFRKKGTTELNLEAVSTEALHTAAKTHFGIRTDSNISIGEMLGKLNCPPNEARVIIEHIAHKDAPQNFTQYQNQNTVDYNNHKSK